MNKWDKMDKIYHAKQEITILEKCLQDAKIRLVDAQGYDEENWWYYIPFLNWVWDYLNK